MKKLLGLLIFAIPAALYAKGPDGVTPTDLAGWGLHCFCVTARHTPQGVVRADNNGQILWRAQDGVAKSELRAEKIPAQDSQLLLLRTFGLLQQDGDRFITTFPIVGPNALLAVRGRLRALSVGLAPQLASDIASISERLTQTGYAGHAYAVVFGYALDGLLWDELAKRDALPDTALDLDHPIWKGAFWAIYPERTGTPGTNEDALGDETLVSVWTDRTAERLKSFVRGIGANVGAHDEFSSTGTGGTVKIPLIRNMAGDAIHDHAQRIAYATAAALVDSKEGREILGSIPRASRPQAVVIVAHELIWDVIEQLVEKQMILAPDALGTKEPSDAQLQKLIFLRAPK